MVKNIKTIISAGCLIQVHVAADKKIERYSWHHLNNPSANCLLPKTHYVEDRIRKQETRIHIVSKPQAVKPRIPHAYWFLKDLSLLVFSVVAY